MPVGLQADVVDVKLSGQHKHLVAAQQQNESWAWAPWSMTESRLREIVHEYDQHKVLHFTDIGHVLLESYRLWDSRKSHATYDHHQKPQHAA